MCGGIFVLLGFLLVLSVVAASLYSMILHKVDFKENGSVFLLNLMCSAVWCVCLLIANGFRFHPDGNILLWGTIYGMTQALFILFKAKAMNEGAVSLTTLIGNCSLIISVFACPFLWHESVSSADIIGLAVLMFGIFLTTYRSESSNFRSKKKWLIYALFFLIFSAAVGLIFKAFSKSSSGHAGDMMIVASVVMLLSYVIICLINGDFRKKLPPLLREHAKTFLITALIAGVLSCVYNRLNIYLSGEMIGAVFFPCFNGGTVVLSTLLGVSLFHEKLSKMQLIGIVFGIGGICIIGIL